jgi:hypothetical protein
MYAFLLFVVSLVIPSASPIPIPSPPTELDTAPCGIWDEPTDRDLLFVKSETIGPTWYALRLGFGGRIRSLIPDSSASPLPKGNEKIRLAMLYLRLDDGPGWYVTPQDSGPQRQFDLLLTGLQKGKHRLVAAMATRDPENTWQSYLPYLVRCFTIGG